MLVVARTTTRDEVVEQKLPKSHGLSLFLVDPKSKGVTKTPIPTVATEGVYQWQLFFDNVEIPAENLVGVEDQGVMAMFTSLNPERILVGGICCGMAEQAIGMAVNYAKERARLQGHADRRVPGRAAPARARRRSASKRRG